MFLDKIIDAIEYRTLIGNDLQSLLGAVKSLVDLEASESI